MAKKNYDISADTLKELVKTHGDGIVTGYVRYKKVKTCKGFKEAEDKASLKLSHIVGGRLLPGNRYAAVIRFKVIFFILLFLCMLPVMTLWRNDSKAQTREPITEASDRSGESMDIPGYGDIILEPDGEGILLYNPKENPCGLMFCILSGENVVYESEVVNPGQEIWADIYNRFEAGVYEIEIITFGVTKEGETLNSVSQTIKLEIMEE